MTHASSFAVCGSFVKQVSHSWQIVLDIDTWSTFLNNISQFVSLLNLHLETELTFVSINTENLHSVYRSLEIHNCALTSSPLPLPPLDLSPSPPTPTPSFSQARLVLQLLPPRLLLLVFPVPQSSGRRQRRSSLCRAPARCVSLRCGPRVKGSAGPLTRWRLLLSPTG